MSEFSDFLGHILEEITRARSQADYAAVRTAKMYAADSEGLLKNFAIPRMRLPNIEITAPLAITNVPDGFMQKTDAALLSKSVSNDLQRIFATRKINVNITEIVKIIKEDEFLSKGYLKENSSLTLSEKIGAKIKLSAPKERIPGEAHAKIVALIHEQLVTTFSALPKESLGIGINAQTSVIKEYNSLPGQNSNVIYVKMSVTEDAMEIEFEPSESPMEESTKIKRLLPE